MKVLFILISLLVLPPSLQEKEVMLRSEKKVNKYLAELWPDIEVITELLHDPYLDEREELYLLKSSDRPLGFLIVDQEMSKYDLFDYMVVFDRQGLIMKSHILIYREDYGGEIASQRWLRQFIGKSSRDPLELRNDISGISGATISCQSACAGIKDLTRKIEHILSTHSDD